MQARMDRDGDIVIVHLSGRVDVETAEPFRKACLQHLADKRVVFDFSSLSFVGSSGLLPFLETMQDFAAKNPNPFYFTGVGAEFRKLFAATPLAPVAIFEMPRDAVHAIRHPAPPAPQPVQEVVVVNAMAIQAAPLQATAVDYGYLSLRRHVPEEAAGAESAAQDYEE